MFGYTIDELRDFWDRHCENGLPKVVERQHYIPVKYLEAWKTGRRIAVKIGGSEPRMVGVRDVAVKSWCYAFSPLSLLELEAVLNCAEPENDYERHAFTLLFAGSIVPQIARRMADGNNDAEARLMRYALESKGFWSVVSEKAYIIRCFANMRNSEQCDKGYELLRKGSAERIMTGIENSAWPYMRSVRNGKLGFMREAGGMVQWLEYVFLQMFRTMKFDRVLKNAADEAKIPCRIAEHMIPYLRFIYAVKMSCKAIASADVYDFRLIRNASGVPFVTSDYPFVHLQADQIFDFIFPVSPSYGFYMGRKGLIETEYAELKAPSTETIKHLNETLKKTAVIQVFAQSCNELIDAPNVDNS